MPFPLISVIIPTYNRAHFLPEAIESIRKQNYLSIEIIIVDDGSTDNTKQLVQNLGKSIKYIYQENKGPAAARNAGLRGVNGEIIGFLDSDDLWPPNKLKLQLSTLLNSSTTEIIMGGVKHLMLSNYDENEFIEHSESFSRNPFGCGLFKLSAFEKVGLLDEKLIQ
ncbi:MAG: glycosyltransferase family 2 protein, partial [Thermodesulfobacteriota bacterium]